MRKLFYKIKNKFSRSYGKDIDYNTLIRMVRENNGVKIIDVRTKDEYYSGHIENAINIPLQNLNERINTIVRDKNDIIIVYCEYGGRSKKACIKLEKMGYMHVYNLENGIARI